MLDGKDVAGLDELEERVYGDVITRIRALAVPDAQRQELIDGAMRILCDTQDGLKVAGSSASLRESLLADAWQALGAFEQRLDQLQ